jgi:hypothetical protein
MVVVDVDVLNMEHLSPYIRRAPIEHFSIEHPRLGQYLKLEG